MFEYILSAIGVLVVYLLAIKAIEATVNIIDDMKGW